MTVSDDELKKIANAIHRGFGGAYLEVFPEIVLELLERRGLEERCHLCGKNAHERCAGHRLER